MVRMRFSRSDIDGGRPFDWSRASPTYARYRDIYPREMLDAIGRMGRCSDGHRVLDVGTGTGVIPRMMRDCGAEWTGIDPSPGQISQAMSLSEGMGIRYLVSSVEDADLPDSHFDTVAACQCMQYFDHPRAARNIRRMLAPRGLLLFAYMAWLPDEDVIARATEDLVLEYNPRWSGAGETVHPIDVPDVYLGFFEPVDHIEFVADVPFTRDTWNGRVRSCRGIGASLPDEVVDEWESDHLELLRRIAPEEFTVRHCCAISVLSSRVRGPRMCHGPRIHVTNLIQISIVKKLSLYPCSMINEHGLGRR